MDFDRRMKEERQLEPIKTPDKTGWYDMGRRIGGAVDECIDERTIEIVRSRDQLVVSEDEPKGVGRMGVRLTAIPRGGCEVRRVFLELAPLKEVVARISPLALRRLCSRR